MKFKKFVKAADGHIIGGDAFLWKCYPNGQYMDVSDIDGAHIGGCIFDTETNLVYEVTLDVADDNVAFRWIDPAWVDAYRNEAIDRDTNPDIAWDDLYYTTVDNEEDILRLMKKVIHHTYVHSHASECTNKCESCSCDTAVDSDGESDGEVETEYEVRVTEVQIIGVRAKNMEAAVTKATEFTHGMKPGNYPFGVSWLDRYDVKAEVAVSLNGDCV